MAYMSAMTTLKDLMSFTFEVSLFFDEQIFNLFSTCSLQSDSTNRAEFEECLRRSSCNKSLFISF